MDRHSKDLEELYQRKALEEFFRITSDYIDKCLEFLEKQLNSVQITRENT